MEPETLKIFLLNRKVLFPHCTAEVTLKNSVFSKNLKKGDRIAAYPTRSIFDLLMIKHRYSVFSEITELERLDDRLSLQIRGISRVRLKSFSRLNNSTFEFIEKRPGGDRDLAMGLRKKAQELIFLINSEESDKLINLMNFLVDPGQMTDFIANYFILDYKFKIKLLNEPDTVKRSEKLLAKLDYTIKNIGKTG